MKDTKWISRWKTLVAPTRVPGVWKRKEGGHLVRARVVDPTTGKQKEIKKVMPDADEATAYKFLSDEKARIRAGVVSAQRPKTRFAEFASSLFERKVRVGEIKSARGRAKWGTVLEHLIGGTDGENAKKHVAGFGDYFLDQLRVVHVEAWKAELADLIKAGDYSPKTANGWFAILRVILKAAKRELDLVHLASDGVKDFDESEHDTYSEEEPNALTPEEVPRFMSAMRELYPQHYAMVHLGLATGLRPSSLRPLRRKGPMADILWDEGKLLVRRSHSLGQEVMNTTKQRVKYRIHLPPEVLEILRWHVETQLVTPEQKESELLFPGVHGEFRSPSVLNKPFADVANEIGLGKKFTQRGLRRTFNDLARAAEVQAIVTRSISGHLTERMQDHYSTVNPDEQRASIGKVVDLMKVRAERRVDAGGAPAGGAPAGGAPGGPGGAPGGAPADEVVLRNEKAG